MELLAAVAIALTHRSDLVLRCGPLPPSIIAASPHAWGVATPGPPAQIWLLKFVCDGAVRGEHLKLTAFAHEILHVRRDPWCAAHGIPYKQCHRWIYRWDDWYAENVVRWKMRRLAVPKAGDIPVDGCDGCEKPGYQPLSFQLQPSGWAVTGVAPPSSAEDGAATKSATVTTAITAISARVRLFMRRSVEPIRDGYKVVRLG